MAMAAVAVAAGGAASRATAAGGAATGTAAVAASGTAVASAGGWFENEGRQRQRIIDAAQLDGSTGFARPEKKIGSLQAENPLIIEPVAGRKAAARHLLAVHRRAAEKGHRARLR
jgi:hypothetical protein